MAPSQKFTTIEELASDFHLKVRRDEYGDPIVEGRRGHLYMDGGKVCLMATDARPRHKSKWGELGGSLWMGSISRATGPEGGRRVQDVEVRGIEATKIRLALKILGIRTRRAMTESQKANLAKGTPFRGNKAVSGARIDFAGQG